MLFHRRPLEIEAEQFDPNDREQAARLGILSFHVAPVAPETWRAYTVYFLVSDHGKSLEEVKVGEWIETRGERRIVRGAGYMVEFEPINEDGRQRSEGNGHDY